MTKKLFILVMLILVSAPVFAQSVDTAWVRRYNGPGHGLDMAMSIALDNSENVCVTGYSQVLGNDYDYATIKYYSNGDTAWVRRYDIGGTFGDIAVALATDGSGNAYVTGWSYGNGTHYDYATIKYYPNGDTGWVRRYNGPENSADAAYDIAVDGSNNVYVTGVSGGEGRWGTIKYYPNGDTAWVRRYNAPTPSSGGDEARALAVDGSGNVYVTGQCGGDYATIKYSPTGDTTWVARYNGPGNYYDKAFAIAVDGSGNVYVTGYSYGSETSQDYATIKYAPNGDTTWVRRYNGPGSSDDEAQAITVDGSGNVYVTGESWDSGTWLDYATIKYYSNGDTAWVRRYRWEPFSSQARAIAVDDSGNVYVTGKYHTIKYHPNGDTAWAIINDRPENPSAGSSIAIDDSCNVYVTGWGSYGSGTLDYVTIKYVQFLCGDVNRNGIVDLGDLVYLISYLYKSGPPPVPILHAGDANCDENVNLGDIVYLITYLYKSGPAPCC